MKLDWQRIWELVLTGVGFSVLLAVTVRIGRRQRWTVGLALIGLVFGAIIGFAVREGEWGNVGAGLTFFALMLHAFAEKLR